MVIVFDSSLCTGCRACELACSFVSEGFFAPSLSRIRVIRMDEEGLDVPISCFHCDDAPCISVCPAHALRKNPDIGAVVLEQSLCIGCRLCISACPFGAIHYNSGRGVLYKCDLCGGEPECVKWCFTGAIRYSERPEEQVKAKMWDYARRIEWSQKKKS